MAGTSSPPPSQLGRYRVLRRLGAGGMAEVFLAKSTGGAEGVEKILVVKRVLPSFARSAKFQKMFVDEAKVAMRLNHPNIVQVYAFEQVKDEFLLAMEFVDGLDLGRLVSSARRRGIRFPATIAAWIVAEAAKGLDYAHNRKDERNQPLEIVHRDVSPQNLLLGYEGTVKVADFGIARATMVYEETGVIKGKFSYMSPEQARGERVDRRSDVYALGVVLSELVMGRQMYPGLQGLDVLEQVRLGRVTFPRDVQPHVPNELDAICRRALSFDRTSRYPNARAFASDLTRFLHAQDELVDASALERLMAELVPREVTSPDGREAQAERSSQTAATVAALHGVGEREKRERRHVVIVAGVVRSKQDGHGTTVLDDEAGKILRDIAFKAEAVFSFSDAANTADRRRFRFILGLGRATVHDPLSASRLALDVLEALDGLAEDQVNPLTASLGMSRGVVSTVRDANGRLVRYEPVGSVVEVAERLAEAGAASEVLASGDVYRLARREFAFDEKLAREVTVTTGHGTGGANSRGIRAFPLRRARTQEERAADAAQAAASERLIGRESELRAIAEAYEESQATKKSVFVAITGDLGIGKTALATAAVEALEREPRVLRAECAFGATDVPFATVSDLVRAACGVSDETTSTEAREKLRETLAKLEFGLDNRTAIFAGVAPLVSPESDPHAHDNEEGGEQSRAIVRAVRLMFEAMARREPLVVVIDALQWCDTPSLELLSVLARRGLEAPVLVVLASRPDPRIEPVLAGVPRIELEDLDDEERRRLIRARFGGTVATDVEQAVVDRAGGNPFFIEELVEALTERGVVLIEGEGDQRRVSRRPGASIVLPTTLEGAIAARLSDLPDEERLALRWLAVSGPGLRASDLATLSGVDLAAPLESLVRRSLVAQRGETFAFQSAVVRQLAYESTDQTDRVRMHRRMGAHLAALGGAVPPARVARHLERAGDHQAAAEAYMAAGAAARGVYSNREALRFYARALSLLSRDSSLRFRVHEAREQILRVMGRRRDQLFELEAMRALAERTGSHGLRAIVHNRLARYELDGGRTAGVDALLRKGLEAAIEAGERAAEVESLYLTVFLRREQGDVHGALEAADKALARAGLESDQLGPRANVVIQRSILLWRIGRLDEALEAAAEAFVIFRRLGLKGEEARALNTMGVTLASQGAYEDAITLMRTSIALDREIGDLINLGMKLSNVGQMYFELGDIARAKAFLQHALEVFEAFETDSGRSDALCSMAEMALAGGEDAETAQTALDEARMLAERAQDKFDMAHERIVRSMLETKRGKLAAAEASARDGANIAHSAGLVGFEMLALAKQAEALAALGRIDDAVVAARKARDGIRGQTVERIALIQLGIGRALAAAGKTDEAKAVLQEASGVLASRVAQVRDPALREAFDHSHAVEDVRQSLAQLNVL